MTIELRVSFVGGTVVKDAAPDMIRLAKLLDVCVVGTFNGVEIFAFADTDPEEIVSWYWKARGRSNAHIRHRGTD